MKFEDKVALGKEAIKELKEGKDMGDIIKSLTMTCMFDAVFCPDGEEADPIEIIILGTNEDTIEKAANDMYENMIKFEDAEKDLEYKEMVNTVKTLAEKLGKPEVVSNFLPVRTIIGMAMVKAGERMMRGE